MKIGDNNDDDADVVRILWFHSTFVDWCGKLLYCCFFIDIWHYLKIYCVCLHLVIL